MVMIRTMMMMREENMEAAVMNQTTIIVSSVTQMPTLTMMNKMIEQIDIIAHNNNRIDNINHQQRTLCLRLPTLLLYHQYTHLYTLLQHFNHHDKVAEVGEAVVIRHDEVQVTVVAAHPAQPSIIATALVEVTISHRTTDMREMLTVISHILVMRAMDQMVTEDDSHLDSVAVLLICKQQ
jgi:hypothetical protein